MSELAEAEPLTASEMLKNAREAAGLSQDQVAQELYLTPAYIRLIDSDEIDKIAKQAFVRGYLRSYAKLVHVDDDEVVARFERSQSGAPPKVEIRRVTRDSIGSTNFTGPVVQTGILGLIGLVVVIALVWFLTSSEEEPVTVGPAVSSTASEVDAVEADNGLSSLDIAADDFTDASNFTESTPTNILNNGEVAVDNLPEAETSNDTPAVAAVTNNNRTAESARPETEAASAEPSDLAETSNDTAEDVLDAVFAEPSPSLDQAELVGRQIEVQRAGNIVSVAAGGDDELRFFFTDECWVEIEDAEGNAIYGDLNRAGEELIVAGNAPFEVLFGKAPAVTLEYNGLPIDLAPHTTSVDTAKLKVGN